MSEFFDELLKSVQQMDEISKGERSPSREVSVDVMAKGTRKGNAVAQKKFSDSVFLGQNNE